MRPWLFLDLRSVVGAPTILFHTGFSQGRFAVDTLTESARVYSGPWNIFPRADLVRFFCGQLCLRSFAKHLPGAGSKG